MSTDVVLLNIFKVYCDPGNLVIVLNSTEVEEKYFIERLNDENVHSTTFSTNTTERYTNYDLFIYLFGICLIENEKSFDTV